MNPLFDWTRDRVVVFVRDCGVPYNPLHDRGFLSIGCAPCTRAVAPGEPERAARWWWGKRAEYFCATESRLRRNNCYSVTRIATSAGNIRMPASPLPQTMWPVETQ